MNSKRISGKGSKWISPIKREAIYARDGFACVHCGRNRSEGLVLSLDHVVPVSMGGCDSETNLVTSCCLCNSTRGNSPITNRIVARTAKLLVRKPLDLVAGKAEIAKVDAIKAYYYAKYPVSL